MTDEQWAELEPFVKADAEARQKLHYVNMTNTPLDPREAIEAETQAERTRIEASIAAQQLAAAKARILGLGGGLGQTGMTYQSLAAMNYPNRLS